MGGEIFRVPAVLSRSDRVPGGLVQISPAGAAGPCRLEGMVVQVFGEIDSENVWVCLNGGSGGVPQWYGPGDLRNAAVSRLVNDMLMSMD